MFYPDTETNPQAQVVPRMVKSDSDLEQEKNAMEEFEDNLISEIENHQNQDEEVTKLDSKQDKS